MGASKAWLHGLSRVLQVTQVNHPSGVAGRQAAQRRRLALELLAAAELKLPQQEPLFWRGLRWGGLGFLVAQALHHFLAR
ncbi:MAG: hypothetical protein VKJ87_05560 [Synechococcus sp.]|nr:hypothetical protein [Synechococcus sp.]